LGIYELGGVCKPYEMLKLKKKKKKRKKKRILWLKTGEVATLHRQWSLGSFEFQKSIRGVQKDSVYLNYLVGDSNDMITRRSNALNH
jgi:hypothetical protein